jgi:hypothetical protein
MSSWWNWIYEYIESNFFEPYICKCDECTCCSSVVEYVRLAAPEDGPFKLKHVVLHMLINNCCIDSRICICWLYSRNRMQTLKIKMTLLLSSMCGGQWKGQFSGTFTPKTWIRIILRTHLDLFFILQFQWKPNCGTVCRYPEEYHHQWTCSQKYSVN